MTRTFNQDSIKARTGPKGALLVVDVPKGVSHGAHSIALSDKRRRAMILELLESSSPDTRLELAQALIHGLPLEIGRPREGMDVVPRIPDTTPHYSIATRYLDRFVGAIAAICRVVPDREMCQDWTLHRSEELQDWCFVNSPFGWAQGIGIIDAAEALACNPAEGANHEPAPSEEEHA